MTPMINATAPTSRINFRKFICWVCPLGPVRNHVENRSGLGGASTDVLFLFGVVAVARKELDALVGHGLTVLLAVLAAVFLAIGIVVRQRATMDVPQEHGVSSVMFLTLLRRPLWWGGTAAAVAGYVFQALALANGSLLLVQPILVSGLLFALPMSARLAHRRVTRGEWAWAMVLTAALAVFVVLAKTRPGDYEASVSSSALVAVICTAAVARASSSRSAPWDGARGVTCSRGRRVVRCRRGAHQAGDAPADP